MIFNIFQAYDTKTAVFIAVGYIALIVVSLSLHEFAHAFIAYKSGDSTAKMNGRMTVNPMAHIDPIGFLMLIFVGFGFAKPVPVNFSNFRKRRNLFAVAVAGVIVNLCLAIILSFLYVLMIRVLDNNYSYAVDVLMKIFGLGAFMNLALFVFNLLPIFPLDGFRVVESVASNRNKYVQFMRRYGNIVLLGLIVWSVIVGRLCAYFPSSEYVLQYFDVLGYVINFFTGHIMSGLEWLWARVLF